MNLPLSPGSSSNSSEAVPKGWTTTQASTVGPAHWNQFGRESDWWNGRCIIRLYIYIWFWQGKTKPARPLGWYLFFSWFHDPNCKIVWMKSKKHVHKESTGKQNCDGSLLTQTIFLRYQLWGLVSWESSRLKQSIQQNAVDVWDLRLENIQKLWAHICRTRKRKYPGPLFESRKKLPRESWELCQTSLDTSQPLKRNMRFIHTSLQSSVTQDAAKRPDLQHSCVSVILLLHMACCKWGECEQRRVNIFSSKAKNCNCQSFTKLVEMKRIEWVKQVPEETYVCVYIYIYNLSTFPGWWFLTHLKNMSQLGIFPKYGWK